MIPQRRGRCEYRSTPVTSGRRFQFSDDIAKTIAAAGKNLHRVLGLSLLDWIAAPHETRLSAERCGAAHATAISVQEVV